MQNLHSCKTCIAATIFFFECATTTTRRKLGDRKRRRFEVPSRATITSRLSRGQDLVFFFPLAPVFFLRYSPSARA